MEKLKFGFNSNEIPVLLTNNTSQNDACASFYFRQNEAYYLLWVDHQNPKCRENENSSRYTISRAINEGDDRSPDIYNDSSKSDLFQSDNVDELMAYLAN